MRERERERGREREKRERKRARETKRQRKKDRKQERKKERKKETVEIRISLALQTVTLKHVLHDHVAQRAQTFISRLTVLLWLSFLPHEGSVRLPSAASSS